MAYDKTNRFSLNKNTDATPENRRPTYKGQINIDGVEYWLDAYVQDGANGKFFSGSVKPKQPRQDSNAGTYGTRQPSPSAQQYASPAGNEANGTFGTRRTAPAPAPERMNDFLDDDIPFAPEWR